MAKKRKVNKKKIKRLSFVVIVFLILVSGLAFGAYKGISVLIYRGTYEYKLIEAGYSKEESLKLLDLFEEERIKELIIEEEINTNLLKLINEKYFLVKNTDRYLDYFKKNKNETPSYIVSMVNVNRDRDLYEGITSTDVSKGYSLLVNKYHQLEENYVPNGLYPISVRYCYGENSLIEEVYDEFIRLFEDAKEAGLFIVINSSYRDYNEQKSIYDDEMSASSIEYADSYIARPGHSEHQTGLTIDVSDGVAIMEEFEETEEFKWMEKNAHKYGFILRYPKDKEDITGYSYESWHYRYLGKDLATKVYNSNLTYDEYYAYYLDK